MKIFLLRAAAVVLLHPSAARTQYFATAKDAVAHETAEKSFGKNFAFVSSDAQSSDVSTCGSADENACLPAMPLKSFGKLDACLREKFPRGREQTVVYVKYPDGSGRNFTKITDPRDGEKYYDARYVDDHKLPGSEKFATPPPDEMRWPAVIVYAENEDEVRDTVMCATSAGYKIAPRGRGHSYRGLSTMDGYVVIDVSPMCHPDEFTVDREVADWALPGQKRIGAIKTGPGCTNAVMLGFAFKAFPAEEGGLYSIGQCPSVGIVGYTSGGGAGDVTPWIGWAADGVLEVDMILHDGTKVTANEAEHTDLFWAVRGGGSGLGVITSITTAVVQSPEPQGDTQRKFLHFRANYKTPDDETRISFLDAVQLFLYDSPESARYGGGGGFYEDSSVLHGNFLGSLRELIDIFGKAGLLNSRFLDSDIPTTYSSNYAVISPDNFPDGMPAAGLEVWEFDSYGEAMLTSICQGKTEDPSSNLLMVSLSEGLSWCKDMNISEDKCTEVKADGFIPFRVPKCDDPEVISAMADAAIDPVSFMNRQGHFIVSTASFGGLLIPKLEVELFNKLVKEVGVGVNHLQHGAPMTKSSTYTAYPWRDTAILTEFFSADALVNATTILANHHYKDSSKLQGYYNYLSPPGNPNWKHFYFGNNYDRLSQIKAYYDPLDFFSNPWQVKPAIKKRRPLSRDVADAKRGLRRSVTPA